MLVPGSGNIVHNLRDAIGRKRDTDRLVQLWQEDEQGRLAHPTPDHWLPFIYTLGLVDAGDEVRFPIEGFDLGSIGMRSILWSPA